MINKFPNIQSVVNYSNPLFMVQIFNIITNEGSTIYCIYFQDMHTFKILYYQTFNNPVKNGDAFEAITGFINILKSSKNLTLVFLKTSPFSNITFLNMMDTLNLNCSFYKRSETLIAYQTQKLAIKGLVMCNPKNIDMIFHMWNNNPPKLNINNLKI